MKPLRVGMIGASWGLVGHLPAWRNIPGVEVAAICTAHEETAKAAAEAHGISRAFWDYREMVADPDLDIIDVGTRPNLRHDMVLKALEAGKHVLNANPFDLTLEAVGDLLAAQRSAGTVGMVEAQFQWLPQFGYMKQLIAEGYLGELYSIRVRCDYPLVAGEGSLYPFVARPGYTTYSWLADPEAGASVLRNMGGHCLHAMIDLFGPVARVSAELDTCLGRWVIPDGETVTPRTHDTATVLLRFANGASGRLETSYVVADARGFELEMFGSAGRLRLTSVSGFPDSTNAILTGARIGARGMTDSSEAPIETPAQFWQAGGRDVHVPEGARVVVPLTRLFQNMVDGIRGDATAPKPDFAQAYHVHEIVEAAERAAASGQRQTVTAP